MKEKFALSPETLAWHHKVFVVDLHADTLTQAYYLKKNISKQHRPPLFWNPLKSHADLPRLRQGGINAQLFGLVTSPYPSRSCTKRLFRLLSFVRRIISERPDEIEIALHAPDLLRINGQGKIAAILTVEGAHVLQGKIEPLHEMHGQGVRSMGLAHFTSNEVAICATDRHPGFQGLSLFGKRVLEEMNRLGMIIDLAHVSRSTFFAALEVSSKPVIVSHTGIQGVNKSWRNIDDDQLKAIAENGGVVGIIFHPPYLDKGIFTSITKIVEHIERVVEVAGIDHVGLGSDFDGFIYLPRGIKDVRDLPRITAALLDRGYRKDAVEKILGENFRRVFQTVDEICK